MTAGIRVSVTQPSAPTSMEHTNTGLPFGLFRFFNMNNPIIFAGALTVFAGALPPWAPVTGTRHHLFRGVVSVHLQMLLVGTCRLLSLIHI